MNGNSFSSLMNIIMKMKSGFYMVLEKMPSSLKRSIS